MSSYSTEFLANLDSVHVRYMLLSICLSSVMVVHPTQAIRQCFYAIWYLGHLWPFGKNFTESGTPLLGVKLKRVAKYSDFGPFQGYILEMVQDRS